MRMIDADVLKDRLQTLSYDDWNQGVSTTWANAYAECADMVEDMPTIEQERKKGKWYKPTGVMPPEHFGRHRCSECEGFAMQDWKHHKEQLTDFCSNCGARMVKEGAEHD